MRMARLALVARWGRFAFAMTSRHQRIPAHPVFGNSTVRSLPERAFVSLSEVLSWKALGRAVDCNALASALTFGERSHVFEARLMLINAADWLADIASADIVRMDGVYVPPSGELHRLSKSQPIPREAFHHFARFDVHIDGFRRGRELAWRFAPEGFDTAYDDRSSDAYHQVKVRRADLVAHCEAEKALGSGAGARPITSSPRRAPSVKKGALPSDEAILAEADALKAEGYTGRQIEKLIQQIDGFENVATVRTSPQSAFVHCSLAGTKAGGQNRKAHLNPHYRAHAEFDAEFLGVLDRVGSSLTGDAQ